MRRLHRRPIDSIANFAPTCLPVVFLSRYTQASLGLVACAWLLFCAGCARDNEEKDEAAVVDVHCVNPTRETVDDTLTLRGRLEPPPGGDLSVASQIPGRVVQLSAHEGQQIAQGDVIAAIEDTASRDGLRQAEAALAQTRAAEVNAKLTLERTSALVTRGIAPKQELEDASARADAATASTAAAVAALDLARRTLGRVVVRSSFAGTVSRVFRGVGALVDGTSATPLIQLAATAGVEFVADATDRELLAVREGQSVVGTLANVTEPLRGTVRARSTSLDPRTGIGSVRIALDSPVAGVPNGTFGRVTVALGQRSGVLVVPVAALRGAVSDGSEVVLCRDKKAELRRVQVGYRDARRVEITAGLEPADRVAIDHVLGLETDTALREAK